MDDYWKTIGRLSDDCLKTFGLLLGDVRMSFGQLLNDFWITLGKRLDNYLHLLDDLADDLVHDLVDDLAGRFSGRFDERLYDLREDLTDHCKYRKAALLHFQWVKKEVLNNNERQITNETSFLVQRGTGAEGKRMRGTFREYVGPTFVSC